MADLMDDPNRQAVGLEPAWVEGTGGSDNLTGGKPSPTKKAAAKKADDVEDDADAEAEKEVTK